jgi:hypothetical protein
MDQCIELINTLSIPKSNRALVATALHQLSVEHYVGIHVLVDAGVYSSAFALYRSQLEAYIRGAWFHRCATDVQVQNFISGQKPPGIEKQMSALENIGAFEPGSLVSFKEMTWIKLCDFTHGGEIQVKVRASTFGDVDQDFKEEHVVSMLEASAITALMACVGLAAVTESEQVAIKLQEVFNTVYQSVV